MVDSLFTKYFIPECLICVVQASYVCGMGIDNFLMLFKTVNSMCLSYQEYYILCTLNLMRRKPLNLEYYDKRIFVTHML